MMERLHASDIAARVNDGLSTALDVAEDALAIIAMMCSASCSTRVIS